MALDIPLGPHTVPGDLGQQLAAVGHWVCVLPASQLRAKSWVGPMITEAKQSLGIALRNAAELAAGTMTDASIPAGCRWIPRGMTVEYLAKADGDVRAVADGAAVDWNNLGDVTVPVMAYVGDKAVLRAEISMYVSRA